LDEVSKSCYKTCPFSPTTDSQPFFVVLVPSSTGEINHRTGQPFGSDCKMSSKGKPVHGREVNAKEIEQFRMFVLNHSDPTKPPFCWQFPEVSSIGFNTSVLVMNIQRLLYDQK
jgi:hypothetical protein